jgi:hypothetical protein
VYAVAEILVGRTAHKTKEMQNAIYLPNRRFVS